MGQRLVLTIKYTNKKTEEPEDMCNCYQHWGGYTNSSIEATDELIVRLQEYLKDEPNFVKALKEGTTNVIRDFCVKAMMESQPGALPTFHDKEDHKLEEVEVDLLSKGLIETSRRVEFLRQKLPDDMGYNRNNGLIGYDQKTIDDLQHWSEGDSIVYIDADGNIEISFGVMFVDEYQSQYEYEREYENDKTDEEYEEFFEKNYYHVDDATMNKFDMTAPWSIETFREFERICDEADKAGLYRFGNKTCNGGSGLIFQKIE